MSRICQHIFPAFVYRNRRLKEKGASGLGKDVQVRRKQGERGVCLLNLSYPCVCGQETGKEDERDHQKGSQELVA